MTDHLTDTNVGNIEYIRREDMLNAVEKLDIIPSVDGMGNPTNAEDFRVQFLGTVLKVEPADVVEVVRCRDCIYQKPDTIYGGNWCWVHREPFMLKTLDGFCSYGERREG